MKITIDEIRKLVEQELQKEDCWDGYERVPGSAEGSPGSCRKKKKLKEEEVEEGKICDKGISYVIRTDPGGKDIKRGKDKDGDGKGDLQNWSARAAQIASKYCKDPDYGKGRGKDAKEGKIHEEEGGLKKWEKENWTHSDGSPCGDGKEDGSSKRCKPAAKWKTMSKSEKAADNAKKKKGTKAGKQYVSATKKGKVTEGKMKSILTEWRQFVKESKADHIEGITKKIANLENEIERAEEAKENMEQSAIDPYSEEMTQGNLMDIRATPQYTEVQDRLYAMNEKLDLLQQQLEQLQQDFPGDLPRG